MNPKEKYREKNRENGLCLDCGFPVEKGVYCNKHTILRMEKRRKYYKNNKEKLLKDNQNRREKYIQQNRCITCSMPLLEEDIERGCKCCENCRCSSTIILKPK